MYTELSLVNACLATMAEAPVADLAVPHPYVPAALEILSRHNKFIQSGRRWWFNTTRLTLTPDSGGVVTASLPTGATGIVGIQGEPYTLNADGTVYDHKCAEIVMTPIEVFVTRELPFSELPPEANNYVGLMAIMEFQENFDGDAARGRGVSDRTELARRTLNAQQTRLMKVNILNRPGTGGTLHNVRGDRPYYY